MVRHPKTLIELMQMYPTEEDCREALFEHRWPQGFSCRRCGHEKARYLRGRGLYECAACHYQGSLTAGTVLAATRTDLRKWFLAVWLLASTKKAPSAAELARQLGVTRKTAWLVRRKIVHAMARGEGELTPGGGLGRAHLRVIENASAKSLTAAALATIAPGSMVQSDGWNGYLGLDSAGYGHLPRNTSTGADVDAWLPWSHIVLSNFERWTLDVFHGVSPRHLQAYLDEYCYRLNRREKREDIFWRLLNRCLLYTGPAPCSLLTGT